MGYRTYTCPIAYACGGCELLAVPYPVQLERKQAQVKELLGEAVEKDGGVVEQIRGMEEPVAYRLKAATPFTPGKGGHVRCGFYASGTHHIVPCEKCLVEDPRARRILNAVARVAEHLHVSAYDEDKGKGVLRNAVVRLGYASDDVLLVIVTNGSELPPSRTLRIRASRAVPRAHERGAERQHATHQRHSRQAQQDPLWPGQHA